MKNAFVLFLIILLCLSCKKSLFNAGDTISREFPVDQDINYLEVKNIFDITLIQDSVNKAFVTCGENLMSDIHISSAEKTLYLDHSVTNNWSRDYEKIKVELHLKTLAWLNIREPAQVITKDTFKTNDFYLVIWGQFAEADLCINANSFSIYTSLDDFGKYVIKGKSNYSELYPCGSCSLDCRNLISEKCKIYQRSIANCYINVTKELLVEFKGQGNIYYSGNPDIQYLNQPSSGKLIQLSGSQ
jgi:hypothetical protein